MRVWDIAVIAVYFIGISAFGVYFSKRNKSTEDYFLGNRSFPGWAIGLSMVGTSISSVSFLSLPGDTFKTTWIRAITYWALPFTTLIAARIFIPFYRHSNATTAYEFLEKRWGSGIRIYASSMYYPAQLLRISTILYLLAQLMHTMLGWPMLLCVVLGGVVVSFYTIAGGIEAVVWTDVVQTIVLVLGGLFILSTIAAEVPGGLGEIIRTGLADHKLTYAELLPDGTAVPLNWSFNFSEKTASVLLLMALLNGVVYMCSDQNLVQRYCAAKSDKEAKKAVWITCWTSLPIWAYFCFLGTAMYVFFKYFPTEKAMHILHGTAGAKAEEILPYFVTNYLPVGMAGLVVASCLAAAMSSLDSSINSVSTVFVNDLYRRYLKRDRPDRHYLKVAHLSAAFTSLFMIAGASVLVVVPTKTLQDTMLQMMAFLNNGIMVIFLLGLLTKIGSIRTLIPGIAAVYFFKIWILCGTAGLIPQPLRIPIDNYYVGIAAEILGMAIVLTLAMFTAIKNRSWPIIAQGPRA